MVQRIAGQGHSSNRTKDNRILLEKETMRKASQAKVEERKANPKMLEHLFEPRKLEVHLRVPWPRAPQTETSTITVGLNNKCDFTPCDILAFCGHPRRP